jgi:hypothetical protein
MQQQQACAVQVKCWSPRWKYFQLGHLQRRDLLAFARIRLRWLKWSKSIARLFASGSSSGTTYFLAESFFLT